MSRPSKKFTILAGPNGAGKTTFVQNLFPEILKNNRFINADYFAQKLNPENVSKASIQAGKKFLVEVDRLLKEHHNFIIETTLSGRGLLKKIEKAQENDFETRLIFLWITNTDLCDFRVKGRVASGGHNIPSQDIHRRYRRGLSNFFDYSQKVDSCEVFMSNEFPTLIYKKDKGLDDVIGHPELYEAFLQSTGKYSLTQEKHVPYTY